MLYLFHTAIANIVRGPMRESDESVVHAAQRRWLSPSVTLSFPEYAVTGWECTAGKVTVSLKAFGDVSPKPRRRRAVKPHLDKAIVYSVR